MLIIMLKLFATVPMLCYFLMDNDKLCQKLKESDEKWNRLTKHSNHIQQLSDF